MNNKALFIDGFLDTISKLYKQSPDARENRDLAFEILGIAAVLDKPFQEVFDKVLVKDESGTRSGKKDGGIDGIFFDDLGDSFDMLVFQCKNSPSLKDKELVDLRTAVREIFIDGNIVRKRNIEDLIPFINEYKDITQSGKVIDIKLYFVFNGNSKDDKFGYNEEIFKSFNNSSPDNSFLICDSNLIYDKLAKIAKNRRKKVEFTFHPENSNFLLTDKQALYTYSIGNTRAANFRVLASEICELVEKEIQINNSFDLLFEENIRQYLGSNKFRANREMNKTLDSEDSILFPFLNNGITIVAEQITVPKSPQDGKYNLPVVNPQIVNGLQTSRVLYDKYKIDPAKLKNVYVNIRIYETKEPSLIEKITDATNTQTPITYKDKISNKDFNGFAKTVFENNGIEYITKRGESFTPKVHNYLKQVDSETVLKFWFATFYEQPELAKNSIAKVLQEIYEASTSENSALKVLFDGDKDSPIYKQLLIAYKIYSFVQNCKSKKIKNETVTYSKKFEHLTSSDELMAYGIYKIFEKKLDLINDENKVLDAYNDTAKTIEEIIQKNKIGFEKIGKTFSFNGYFKKPKCRYDINEKKGYIETDNLIEVLSGKDV